MRYLWHIRWLTPLVLVGYVVWQALFASWSLEAVTDFRERTPYFDVLLPAGRGIRTERGIVLTHEPVYIDIRVPIRARGAAVELKVDSASAPLKLGLQTGEEFSFEFNGHLPETVGGLTLYRYDAKELHYARPGHKVRFIISSPSLVPGSVVVKEATVSLKREPFSWPWFQLFISELL
ncbi:MAG: hypothetical protein U1C53_02485 [Candidatus Veblenbacteria bacterium]|nr:hypothetical protein [Candidatus Veblenbacteria bacterium]MDZ4229981.1 hypothetical protein [Candidatus Veblenbacteria bacterium]